MHLLFTRLSCAAMRVIAMQRFWQASLLAASWLVAPHAQAAWNSVGGIKDGAETANEPALSWDGERLLAFGGTLNFAGSVNVDGEIWLAPMSGWPTPIVNIPGALKMNSPAGQFTISGGADLNIGNAAGSSVEAGLVGIYSGAQLSLGSMIAHQGMHIRDNGTSLELLSNFSQTGGRFLIEGSTSMHIGGAFTKTGDGEFTVGTPSFTIGDAAGSSVEAGPVSISNGAQVTLGGMLAHDNVRVGDGPPDSHSKLRLLGDYEQDGGQFDLFNGGELSVGGAFAKTGSGAFYVNGATSLLQLAHPATSSVEAGPVAISSGAQVTLGSVLAHDNVRVGDGPLDSHSKLHVLGDYEQDGEGEFAVFNSAEFTVGGMFTKTGSGSFSVSGVDTLFQVASPTASSVEAGIVRVEAGGQATLGSMLAHGNVRVGDGPTGSKLHLLGDYEQDGEGEFTVFNGAEFAVGGTFTKTGGGGFYVAGTDTLFQVANPKASSVEAGDMRIAEGANVTFGDMLIHGNVRVGDGPAGSKLHLLGDYEQDGGSFEVFNSAEFAIDGLFTKTGSGTFWISGADTLLQLASPEASSVEAGNFYVTSGGHLTIGDVLIHGNAQIKDTGTELHVLGDYLQDGGDLAINYAGSVVIDGVFTKAGTGRFDLWGADSTFTIGNAQESSIKAGEFYVTSGGHLTIGDVLVHGNAQIKDTGSELHVLGDYLQDGGDLAINYAGSVVIDGVFTKAGTGRFDLWGADSTFTIGNAQESSIEAGEFYITAGGHLAIGDVLVHDNAEVRDTGTELHVLGDYTQDAGNFSVFGAAAISVDGSFTNSGMGAFNVHNATFSAGPTKLNGASIAQGAQATTGNLTLHGTIVVDHAGTTLDVEGDYSQDDGNFHLIGAASMEVAGGFSYAAGNTLEISNNATLVATGADPGASVSNNVAVFAGGKATIGQLTVHGNASVNDPTSLLRVKGDYLQDDGGFSINNNATLNVDGSFRYAVPGPRFVNFGNGFLRVGDTLTIEEGHYWNLAASGGRVRVGDGSTAPAGGTMAIFAQGTLAGGGTIVGDVLNTTGTVAPGMGAGRLDVTGNYLQGASGSLLAEIGGPLAELEHDQLFVSGTATLAGSLVVELIDLGTGTFAPTLGQTFDILKAGGGINGTFASLSLPGLGGGLGWEVNYLANRVQLEVVASMGLSGDFDFDGVVDGADFLAWQRGESPNPLGAGDLIAWKTNFGASASGGAGAGVAEGANVAVPEPGCGLSLAIGGSCFWGVNRKRRSGSVRRGGASRCRSKRLDTTPLR